MKEKEDWELRASVTNCLYFLVYERSKFCCWGFFFCTFFFIILYDIDTTTLIHCVFSLYDGEIYVRREFLSECVCVNTYKFWITLCWLCNTFTNTYTYPHTHGGVIHRTCVYFFFVLVLLWENKIGWFMFCWIGWWFVEDITL